MIGRCCLSSLFCVVEAMHRGQLLLRHLFVISLRVQCLLSVQLFSSVLLSYDNTLFPCAEFLRILPYGLCMNSVTSTHYLRWFSS